MGGRNEKSIEEVEVKKVLLLLIVCGLFLAAFACRLQANDRKGRMNIGLNYPGISFRYGIGERVAVEIKGQFDGEISVIGPRIYYYFTGLTDGIVIFTGLENDVIFFTGDDSKGKGLCEELFIGAEYFINKKLSLGADIGQALILLSDDDTDESEFTTQSIVNISVNYYFQ